MKTDNKYCKGCAFWDNTHRAIDMDKNIWGYCRKHKPIPYIGPDKKYYGGWPLVDSTSSCGEWRGQNNV